MISFINWHLNLLRASQTIEAVSEGRLAARQENAELQVTMQSSAMIEIRGVNSQGSNSGFSIATLQSELRDVKGAAKCGKRCAKGHRSVHKANSQV